MSICSQKSERPVKTIYLFAERWFKTAHLWALARKTQKRGEVEPSF